MTEEGAHTIEQRLRPMIGQKPWAVRLGHGSFVTLDFGARLQPEGEGEAAPRGEWHFWVYCCAWRLDGKERSLVGSDDERGTIEPALGQLVDRSLEAIKVEVPSGQTELRFDGGLALHLFPFASASEDYQVYLPDGQVLIVGPAGDWHEEPAS